MKSHLMSTTILYKKRAWIKRRCYNKNDSHYKNYWWRWIICEWNSFEEFYRDMSDSYREWLTIERIDNNGNYCKSNCRWATNKEQSNNRTTSRIITREWKTQTLKQWAEEKWISQTAIVKRIKSLWLCEDVFKKNNRNYHMIEWNWRLQNITDWAKELWIKKWCLEKRIRCYTNIDKIMYKWNYTTQWKPL